MRSICFVALFALAGCGYHMHISPLNSVVVVDGTVQFTVTDAYNNPADLTSIIWKISGGTINPATAVWSAPDVPGNFTAFAEPTPNGPYVGQGITYPEAQMSVHPHF
jgi:hypothetical protein